MGVFAQHRRRNRPNVIYDGDDRRAKKVAATLIRDVGFEPVDAGPLRIAGYLEPASLPRSLSSRTRWGRVLRSSTASGGSDAAAASELAEWELTRAHSWWRGNLIRQRVDQFVDAPCPAGRLRISAICSSV